ncbi:unnamed protein product [Durusdinium trenchii]|uniref:Uncharacterized protein n=1 Tax=Durusdinium trenchii TaxID=1381693 RepID=A0ABP0LP71_9DINO
MQQRSNDLQGTRDALHVDRAGQYCEVSGPAIRHVCAGETLRVKVLVVPTSAEEICTPMENYAAPCCGPSDFDCSFSIGLFAVGVKVVLQGNGAIASGSENKCGVAVTITPV